METTRPLVLVLGPTGSGKTDLGVRLAERFSGEIVNCDSLQIFRFFNIGTAKPSLGQRRGVPHHLIDIATPDELFTAGEYARRARLVLDEISARGRLPIVTGGTGFYMRALLEGLAPAPPRDDELRAALAARERRRSGVLHRVLRRLDAPSAARIHPRDTNKLTRAIEVCLRARRPLSQVYAEGRCGLRGYAAVKFGLCPDRAELYRRLDERCRAMFRAGLVDEVRSILALGYSGEEKPFESLGYKQALQVLRGNCSLEQAIEDTQRQTRRYAKRQLTWFRREPDLQWIQGFGGDEAVCQEAFLAVQSRLDGR